MKIVLSIISIFFSFCLSAQDFVGTYKDNPDSLTFKSDSAWFSFGGNSGLILNHVGFGFYEIINDFLVIKTKSFNGVKSVITISEGNSQMIAFSIQDRKGQPLQGVIITLLDKKGKFISNAATDLNGKVNLKRSDEIKKISIGAMGYDCMYINYSPSSNYTIELVPYDVVEDEVVVFKFSKRNTISISLILLSIDSSHSEISKKSLDKLWRKNRIYGFRERAFLKQ